MAFILKMLRSNKISIRIETKGHPLLPVKKCGSIVGLYLFINL